MLGIFVSDLYWFPMEYLKFISSTNEMKLEEVGAYVKLMCHQADNGGISPDPSRHPINHPDYVDKIWPQISHKFIAQGDKLVNKKLAEIMEKAVAKHEALSKAGRKGGLSRASRVATSPGQASYNNNKSNNKIKSKSKNKTKKKSATKVAYTSDFETFWTAYPKKQGKQKAWESWQANNPPLEKCLFTIKSFEGSIEWHDPQYIPHPTTWLNQGRWDDEPTIEEKAF